MGCGGASQQIIAGQGLKPDGSHDNARTVSRRCVQNVVHTGERRFIPGSDIALSLVAMKFRSSAHHPSLCAAFPQPRRWWSAGWHSKQTESTASLIRRHRSERHARLRWRPKTGLVRFEEGPVKWT